jgi:hypothetical protein
MNVIQLRAKRAAELEAALREAQRFQTVARADVAKLVRGWRAVYAPLERASNRYHRAVAGLDGFEVMTDDIWGPSQLLEDLRGTLDNLKVTDQLGELRTLARRLAKVKPARVRKALRRRLEARAARAAEEKHHRVGLAELQSRLTDPENFRDSFENHNALALLDGNQPATEDEYRDLVKLYIREAEARLREADEPMSEAGAPPPA